MPTKAAFIGSSAFDGCGKINVDIPEGVTEIGERAFANCTSIAQINVPKATDKIGDYAFSGCSAIEKAVISTCKDGYGKGLFNRCTALTDITLPYAGLDPKTAAAKDSSCLCQLFDEHVSGLTYSITYGDAVYYIPSSLTNITITGGTNIPDYTFYGFSSLKSVTIPDSTEYIGNNSFRGCSSLEEFTIPSKATFIGDNAFNGCGKINVDIPEGVTEIGESAFYGCRSLTEINVPETVKNIGTAAFSDCSGLKKAVINGSDTIIAQNSFDKCTSLESLALPYVIPADIKESKTDYKWLKGLFGSHVSGQTYGLTVGDSTIYIPNSLKELIITNGKDIPNDALSGMHLENVTLPKTVESIGSSAFNGCNDIMNVFFPDTQEAWDKVSVGEKNEVLNEKLRVLDAEGKYHDVVTKATTTSTTTTSTTTITTTAPVTTTAPIEYSLGDVDNNKAVNAVDASAVLIDYAMTSTNKKSELNDAQKKAADTDGNGDVNAIDASYILEYYAYTSTAKENPMTMTEYMAKKSEKTK